jgi:hypothetical protein
VIAGHGTRERECVCVGGCVCGYVCVCGSVCGWVDGSVCGYVVGWVWVCGGVGGGGSVSSAFFCDYTGHCMGYVFYEGNLLYKRGEICALK